MLVGDCNQNPELRGIDLPGTTDPSAVTLPNNTQESNASVGEWETDREETPTYLESYGCDVFDDMELSFSRAGPVLRRTMLDYRLWSPRVTWSDFGCMIL